MKQGQKRFHWAGGSTGQADLRLNGLKRDTDDTDLGFWVRPLVYKFLILNRPCLHPDLRGYAQDGLDISLNRVGAKDAKGKDFVESERTIRQRHRPFGQHQWPKF